MFGFDFGGGRTTDRSQQLPAKHAQSRPHLDCDLLLKLLCGLLTREEDLQRQPRGKATSKRNMLFRLRESLNVNSPQTE
ncbi:hypothetical protein OJAV_G00047230 [Oryzias javanicus]|uniref:Uncharacterized protein n=1 Tax=Oryzias javanicus TaxID=123683 RepID=A0A437DE28_ORYJA|nr:hypothetical protein OJAV_G00047230 [Oryzias javanicus]